MKITYFLLGMSMLVCYSCAPASIKAVEYDAQTGQYANIKYSPRFAAQEFLVPGKLKILVYGKLQNRLGKTAMMGPNQQVEPADFAIYFSNTSETNVVFTINSINLKQENIVDQFLDEPQEFLIIPKTVERIFINNKEIGVYQKQCKVFIDFTYGELRFVKEIDLPRLTVEQAKARKKEWASFFKD